MKSFGKTYREAVEGRWCQNEEIPKGIANMMVENAFDVRRISLHVDFIFSAIKLDPMETAKLEEYYARYGIPVVSNNSAHRWTPDVPMVIPEVNSEHIHVIKNQRERLKTKSGFIATKPNCSVQGYVSAIHALKDFDPFQMIVSTYQAVSGAGRTLES